MTRESHPERIAELMNSEFDGVNSEAESRELAEYLDAHPGAREEFEQLQALTRRLHAEGHVDPPAHLFHRIISAIPFGRHSRPAGSAHESGDGIFSWLGGLFPRPRLRYASTFGVGLVAGVVLLWAAVANNRVDGSLDISNLYGTMKAINPSDGFEVVGKVGVDLDQVHGEIRLHESDRTLLAEVSLSASEEIRWVLRYDGSDIAFEGFRQVEGPAGDMVAATDEMTVNQVGDSRYILFFTETNGTHSTMSIEIFSAGKLLYQNELSGTRNQ